MWKYAVGLFKGVFAGVWGYVGIAALAGLISAGVTHYIGTLPYRLEISNLKLAAKTKEAADISASLKQLQGFIADMKVASVEFAAIKAELNKRFDDLNRRFQNAIKARPLPPGCFPDPERVRIYYDAIDSANAAAAGHGSGTTVRTVKPPVSP